MINRMSALPKLARPLALNPRASIPRIPARPEIQSLRLPPPVSTLQYRVYAQVRRPRRPQPRYQTFAGETKTSTEWLSPRKIQLLVGGCVVSTVIYAYGREEVPITGRRRWNLISPDFVKELVAGGKEQVVEQYRGQILPRNHPISQQAEKILKRLIPASGLINEKWEIRVIDDPDTPNAFVMAG